FAELPARERGVPEARRRRLLTGLPRLARKGQERPQLLALARERRPRPHRYQPQRLEQRVERGPELSPAVRILGQSPGLHALDQLVRAHHRLPRLVQRLVDPHLLERLRHLEARLARRRDQRLEGIASLRIL